MAVQQSSSALPCKFGINDHEDRGEVSTHTLPALPNALLNLITVISCFSLTTPAGRAQKAVQTVMIYQNAQYHIDRARTPHKRDAAARDARQDGQQAAQLAVLA